MKGKFTHILLYTAIISIVFSGCTDTCEVTHTYVSYQPVYTSITDIRESLNTEPARDINNPGRIYYKDQYLYINEAGKGIHVIDNRNPNSPQKLSFINIPGNFDLAAKGNFLYADSYVDLVVLDISNPANITEVNRLNEVFVNFDAYAGIWNPNSGIVTDWDEELIEQAFDSDCQSGDVFIAEEDALFDGPAVQRLSANSGSSDQSTTGIGGSLAKFTIYDNYLYTINSFEMQLFDISALNEPEVGTKIPLGWGIETIFPYGDKLFIGAVNGMHIYDNETPESPEWISTYEHVNSCDPVVVQDDYAYVTLRSGSECEGFTNQLDIVDISNLNNPSLFKTYEMENPHGLGIDGTCLFITEGDFGIKFFDSSNLDDLQLVSHEEGIHAIDVIPLDNNLMIIGQDGFHQYRYNCTTGEFSKLSTIVITNL